MNLLAEFEFPAAVVVWWRTGGALNACGGATSRLVVAGGMVLAVPIGWVTPRTKPQPQVLGQRPHGWSTAGGMVPLTVELVDPPQTVDHPQRAAGLTRCRQPVCCPGLLPPATLVRAVGINSNTPP